MGSMEQDYHNMGKEMKYYEAKFHQEKKRWGK